MNTEYVWWVVVLVLVGAGAVGYLAFGPVPEIEEEPDEGIPVAQGVLPPGLAEGVLPAGLAEGLPPAEPDAPAQRLPVSTGVPGPGEPRSTSDTP